MIPNWTFLPQILQDELSTLQLEYTQQEQKIKDLKSDNANLLQRSVITKGFIPNAKRSKNVGKHIKNKFSNPATRLSESLRWLDKVHEEAVRMNDANQFLVEVEKKGLPPVEPPG
jgi:hypothetical protein